MLQIYLRPHVHVDIGINVNVWTCFRINVTTCINVYVYTRIQRHEFREGRVYDRSRLYLLQTYTFMLISLTL